MRNGVGIDSMGVGLAWGLGLAWKAEALGRHGRPHKGAVGMSSGKGQQHVGSWPLTVVSLGCGAPLPFTAVLHPLHSSGCDVDAGGGARKGESTAMQMACVIPAWPCAACHAMPQHGMGTATDWAAAMA